jgi:hypothetical protein
MPQLAYPQRINPPQTPPGFTGIVTPAASPSGTLVSTLSINNITSDIPAMVAVQFPRGNYTVISSTTVTGNPPLDNRVPALSASFSYDSDRGTNSFHVIGVTSEGDGVVDGYNITQSVLLAHNGDGVIVAGTTGGHYRHHLLAENWSYSSAITIYRLP